MRLRIRFNDANSHSMARPLMQQSGGKLQLDIYSHAQNLDLSSYASITPDRVVVIKNRKIAWGQAMPSPLCVCLCVHICVCVSAFNDTTGHDGLNETTAQLSGSLM